MDENEAQFSKMLTEIAGDLPKEQLQKLCSLIEDLCEEATHNQCQRDIEAMCPDYCGKGVPVKRAKHIECAPLQTRSLWVHQVLPRIECPAGPIYEAAREAVTKDG